MRVSLLAPVAEGAAAGDVKVPLRLESGPEGALVAIDVRTRQILALVGSYEGQSGGLDRATQSRRQPGSTFKAIDLADAIIELERYAGSQFDPAVIAALCRQLSHQPAPAQPRPQAAAV